jgi:hypothetical protein
MMNKTLQTMVGATDTIFFAAVTMVSDVYTMVFFTQTMVPIPGTIFLVNQKMVSGFATTVFVSQTKDSDTRTKVEGSKIMVFVAPTMAGADS